MTALEVFTIMRYININPHFTYLLTYLLTYGPLKQGAAIGSGQGYELRLDLVELRLRPNSITLSGRIHAGLKQVRSWSQTCSELKFGL